MCCVFPNVMCSPAVFCVLLLLLECVTAEDGSCYTPGGVAGIVIATVVVTLIMGALAAAFVWYLWKQRKGGYGNNKFQEKNITCPPMSPDKQAIGNDYAFDNPYFKDDEVDHVKQEDAEKGETGFHLDNGDITPAQNAKASNGTTGQQQQKKNRPFSSLPFHAVFHPSGKKQRAIDDTYISKHMERIMVPLRGHDFTGLGFNICGNMRDGIFVKDVLHRGPASESGKIKAGDRIVGVTVSFGAMVYEDALTILSYASPYDVRLEIEKSPSQPLPPSPKRVGTSTSFRNSSQGRLFHPLYRSQSIMDLSQIGKDNNLSENSPGINAKNQKEATPKRSQSVEASNGGPKARPVYSLKSNDESKSLSSNKGSRKSSTSSCDSSGKVTTATTVPLPEKTQVAPAKEEAPCTKKEVKSSRFRVEQISVKTEAASKQVPPVKPARETAETKQNTPDTDVHAVEKTLDPQPPKEEPEEKPIQAEEELLQEAEKPMAPPRKAGTPAKRKAPAPPPVNPTKTETSALVHRADEQPQEQPILTEPPKPASNPDPPPPPTSQVPDLAASDASSLASRPDEEVEPSSPSRRKASSLGDLTHLEQGSNRKSSTSSAILERAVSMDLQQSIPGENLVKQKKILKAPTFEDDYDENREGDQNDTEGGGRLKRWDDGLDKVLGGLTNGHGDHHASDPHVEEVTSPKKEEPAATETNKPEVDVPAPPKKLLKVDIDLDLSGSESSQNEDGQEDSKQQLTSTPVKKILEVNNSTKEDDISLDEVPFLASSKVETTEEELSTTTSTKHSIRTNSAPLFAPVTISIPIIKPDLKHFENLPSPPTASTHPALDPAWRVSTKVTPSDDTNKSQLERISVQSLYRPIFTDKESQDLDESVPEKMVNGIDSDSSEHYSTAHEADTSADTSSTLSVTLTSPTVANNVAVKAPNSAAGFAKTLIIPGPSEVESLLSLAAEPNTPPPQLDPPPKPIENE